MNECSLQCADGFRNPETTLPCTISCSMIEAASFSAYTHCWQAFAADMCTAVLMTPVRWLPHSQLLLLVEACLCLKACYKVSEKNFHVRPKRCSEEYFAKFVDCSDILFVVYA